MISVFLAQTRFTLPVILGQVFHFNCKPHRTSQSKLVLQLTMAREALVGGKRDPFMADFLDIYYLPLKSRAVLQGPIQNPAKVLRLLC